MERAGLPLESVFSILPLTAFNKAGRQRPDPGDHHSLPIREPHSSEGRGCRDVKEDGSHCSATLLPTWLGQQG